MTEAMTAIGTFGAGFRPVRTAGYVLPALAIAKPIDERHAQGAATVVDMNELAEEFHGWAGKRRWALGGAGVSRAREVLRQLVGEAMLKPHAERRTRRAVAPHDVLDGNRIKAGTFEGSYLVADFRQAADVLPVLTGECLKGARYSSRAAAPRAGVRRPTALPQSPPARNPGTPSGNRTSDAA